MGNVMSQNKRTTHIRVDREVKTLVDIELPRKRDGNPLYSYNEIFKAGYISLKAYNRVGIGLYGKGVWNKFKKK